MSTSCIAQGALLSTLCDPSGEEVQKEGTRVYVELVHFAVQRKLTQQDKAARIQ